jgi:endonuclease/exonuclease/phosphatase (EEP) superfamily protein YafD
MQTPSIILHCLACRQKIRVPKEKFGRPGVCPRCKAPFPAADLESPTSESRASGLRLPHWPGMSSRNLLITCWGWVLVLALVATGIRWLGESAAIHTLLIFGPRWPWLLPLLVLVPAALRKTRFALLPAGIGLLLWLFGVSGFVLNWPARRDEPGPQLRIITCNLQGGGIDYLVFRRYLQEVRPDVVLLQEWSDGHRQAAFPEKEWQLAESGGLWIAVRGPVWPLPGLPKGQLPISAGAGVYDALVGADEIRLVNVHLPTAREGISAVLQRRLSGLAALKANAQAREEVSTLVRHIAVENPASAVVAGDFNMPVESGIYRQHWGDLSNAFSQAGWGWGGTKYTRWHSVRIDHVLFGRDWVCLQASVGPDVGSDHRPVFAVLKRTN